jgi:two-component sensor histidine kinase
VTDARHVAAQNDVVIAEVRHRMKNLLATMQAIANLTDTTGRTAEEYKQTFIARLKAMVEAQDLILAGETEMDLEQLLRKTTSPIAERVAIVPGPAVALVQAQFSPVIMITHELTTNAIKYGSLSQSDGMVHIGWEVEQADGRRMLRLHWREQGGPRPVADPKPGFGTHLLEVSAAGLGGVARLSFEPDGCRMDLAFPIADDLDRN